MIHSDLTESRHHKTAIHAERQPVSNVRLSRRSSRRRLRVDRNAGVGVRVDIKIRAAAADADAAASTAAACASVAVRYDLLHPGVDQHRRRLLLLMLQAGRKVAPFELRTLVKMFGVGTASAARPERRSAGALAVRRRSGGGRAAAALELPLGQVVVLFVAGTAATGTRVVEEVLLRRLRRRRSVGVDRRRVTAVLEMDARSAAVGSQRRSTLAGNGTNERYTYTVSRDINYE